MQSRVDSSSYRLYEFARSGSPRIVQLITRSKGERMVRKQLADVIADEGGKLLCFQLKASTAPVRALVMDVSRTSYVKVDSEPSNMAFSQAEMNAIAGTKFKHGRSRTARLSDEQREERAKRIYEATLMETGRGVKVGPEDIVERATKKLEVWAESRMPKQPVEAAVAG